MKKIILFSFFLLLISIEFIQNINGNGEFIYREELSTLNSTSSIVNSGAPSIVNSGGSSQQSVQRSTKMCDEINAKMNATLLERLNCAIYIDYTIISFFKEILAEQGNLTKQLIDLKKELNDTKNELNQLKDYISKDNSSQSLSSNSSLTGMNISGNNQEKEHKGFFGFFRKIFDLS